MAIILVNGANAVDLAEAVNLQQSNGFTPACGVLLNEGMWYQLMVTGTDGGISYSVIDEDSDIHFASAAQAASAGNAFPLGDVLLHNGRFIQAFGYPAAAAGPVNQDAVLNIINAASLDDAAYNGLSDYVLSVMNSASTYAEDDPAISGLRAFIQSVIDAQP